MKKFLITTLLSAVALASQAQVTLSGKVSQWADNTKVGSASTNSLVTDPTSNFALVAQERARGVTTRAVIETSLRGNTIDGVGTKLGDRQFTAGLSNSFGSVDVGRSLHSHFLAITSADSFGTLYGSIAGDVHNLRGLRVDNAAFVTVTPVKGVIATVDRALSSGDDSTAYSLSTSLYGVAATAARFEKGNETSTVLALSTKLMGTTLSYVHSDDRGAVKSVGDSIGLTKAFGQYTAKASYGRTDRDVTAYALGVDYALSKRTNFGAAYRNVNRVGSASDVQQLGVGLTHRF
jgi:predicted porin